VGEAFFVGDVLLRGGVTHRPQPTAVGSVIIQPALSEYSALPQ